jgi:hypothetical protein
MNAHCHEHGLPINTVEPTQDVGHRRRDCGVRGSGCGKHIGDVLGVASDSGVSP